jgi:DNA-binding NarL/FixJ family response regulator
VTVRVLVVDDQALMRAGIRGILETAVDLEVVGEAADGQQAVDLVDQLLPDVVCMDVQMPGMDGLRATEIVVAQHPEVAVLVLTTFDGDEYLFGALRAGASGFIVKNARPESIIDAVRVLASGDALLAPDVTRRVIERFQVPETTEVAAPTSAWGLTPRELEVVGLVAAGLSNDEIAEALVLGATTVKTHVSHVLAKLRLRDRVQLVVFAFRNGLV